MSLLAFKIWYLTGKASGLFLLLCTCWGSESSLFWNPCNWPLHWEDVWVWATLFYLEFCPICCTAWGITERQGSFIFTEKISARWRVLLRLGKNATLDNFGNDSRVIGILQSLVDCSGNELIIKLEEVFERFIGFCMVDDWFKWVMVMIMFGDVWLFDDFLFHIKINLLTWKILIFATGFQLCHFI